MYEGSRPRRGPAQGVVLGTKVRAKVLEIAEGRIRFSLRALKDDEEHAEFEGFRKKESAEAAQGFGTFGDLLKPRKHK
jgi:predicted RNA-binding protein with RPS1 domain